MGWCIPPTWGGSDWDEGHGIAVDGSGQAYVTGRTRSSDFDITPGAYQTTQGRDHDVFVTKLSVDGRSLVYSTYLGGSSWDKGHGIAVDGSGHAYVVGGTYSTDFDITSGAYQTTYGGGTRDVFVTKLSVDGRSLVYSTYLGGSDWDEGHGIAVDGSGHAYVTGSTESTNFDITPGAYQTTLSGGTCGSGPCPDVFVTKLSVDGKSLVYSTYLGGSEDDGGNGIAVDGSGHAYVTGSTESTNFDITPGAYQTTLSGGSCGGIPCSDVFVAKLSTPSGPSSLPYTWASGAEKGSLRIYPNPNSGAFTIYAEGGGRLELMDGAGRVLRRLEVEAKETEIRIDLPAGLYFIREVGGGRVQKVVIER